MGLNKVSVTVVDESDDKTEEDSNDDDNSGDNDDDAGDMTDEEFEHNMYKMLNGVEGVKAGRNSYKHRKEGEVPVIKKSVKVGIVNLLMTFK